MQKRHTLHGAAQRIGVQGRPISEAPPGESGTRIRGAARSTLSVEENIQASIDFAMAELEALEVPYRASAPPLGTPPSQQMPRGMPPLPFLAPHPRNMPPLPPRPVTSSLPAPEGSLGPEPELGAATSSEASLRPSRWWLYLGLALGIGCFALAFWLQRN